MKNTFAIIICSILYSNLLYGQQQSYIYYSKFITDSLTNSEIKLLDKIEGELYDFAKQSDTKKYTDINGTLNHMTNEEFNYISQGRETSKYENYLIWNSLFNQAYFISFTRLYEDTSANAASREYTRFITPLYYYRAFLDSINYNDFQKLIIRHFKSKFSILLSDSISISMAMLSIDSSSVLAQASINQFSKLLYQASYNSEIPVFTAPSMNDVITKDQWNTITTGVFKTMIGDQSVNMKKQLEPLKLLIVTKWEIIPVNTNNDIEHLQPAFHITRKISSIGFEFSNQKRVFYNYDDIKTFCEKENLFYEAFNQIFTSSSIANLRIQY
jgi:hypothetical protein